MARTCVGIVKAPISARTITPRAYGKRRYNIASSYTICTRGTIGAPSCTTLFPNRTNRHRSTPFLALSFFCKYPVTSPNEISLSLNLRTKSALSAANPCFFCVVDSVLGLYSIKSIPLLYCCVFNQHFQVKKQVDQIPIGTTSIYLQSRSDLIIWPVEEVAQDWRDEVTY